MKRIRNFITTTILGGFAVLLPILLTGFFLKWMYRFITDLLKPLTEQLVEKVHLYKVAADSMAILIIIGIFFLLGLIIKTRLGKYFHDKIETLILKIMPGYSLFRETVKQFLGQKKTPFSRVALVQVFQNSTLMTGFVTDEHPDGHFTVYVPSGLNPTSGIIYHLEPQYVHLVDATVEETMRSIISCGAGSQKILAKLKGKVP